MDKKTRVLLILLGVGIVFVGMTSFSKPKKKKTTDKSKNYIIGDSQTPFIDNASEKAKRIKEKGGEDALWLGGMGLKWLKGAVDKYPVSEDVNSIIINIGTNGGFNKQDDISGLITSLKTKFPNATLYAVKGSWGWGGIKNKTEQQVNVYYDVFTENGVKVLNTAIGKVNDPHGNLAIYKTIGKEIDEEIKL